MRRMQSHRQFDYQPIDRDTSERQRKRQSAMCADISLMCNVPCYENSVLPVVGVLEDALPFLSLLPVGTFNDRVMVVLIVLHDSLVRCAGYDSRVRVMIHSMCRVLRIRWEWFVEQENRYEESNTSRAMRYLKIGSAVVVGGVAIGLTGGLLAAPLLGAGLAGIGLTSAGATVSALVASSSGVVLVSSIFGIGQTSSPQITQGINHRTYQPIYHRTVSIDFLLSMFCMSFPSRRFSGWL